MTEPGFDNAVTATQPSGKAGGTPHSVWRPMLGLVVIVAAVVRLLYVSQSRDVPFALHLVGDAAGYISWAARIAEGDWIGSEPFYQAPLYPYVLAVLFSIGIDEIHSIRLVQALWGSLAAGLLAVAGHRWFGWRVGVLSGFAYALFAPAVFYDGLIQKTSLAGVLTCGVLAVLSGMGGSLKSGRLMLLGVLCALLALTRENALIWIPLLIVFVVARSEHSAWSRRLARGGLLLIGVVLILGPVAIRNYALGGGLAPTTSQFGPNFYIGNRTGADGLYHPLIRGHETPAFERADATRLAELALGRSLSAQEVSDYWRDRAWDDIQSDPWRWLGLMWRKLLMVVNDYEVADAEGMVVYADASPILAMLRIMFRFGLLFPLALMGGHLYRHSWREFWIIWVLVVAMMCAIALFFVLGRYRFPLVPLLIPLAVAGCLRFGNLIRDRDWRGVVGAVVVGIVGGVASNWPVYDVQRLDAMARMNAGVALASRGDLPGALEYFERAVAGFPESPEANANLGQALAQVGEATGDMRYFERAVEHYRRAVRSGEPLPGMYFNLGVALERLGRIAAAKRAYRQAAAQEPADIDARRALERLSK